MSIATASGMTNHHYPQVEPIAITIGIKNNPASYGYACSSKCRTESKVNGRLTFL